MVGRGILGALRRYVGKESGAAAKAAQDPAMARFVDGFSIEVLPRNAARIEDFRAILPQGTRIYITHVDDTPIDDMVRTARRLRGEGFDVMPHIPARSVPDIASFADWVARYRGEADVSEALLVAGGRAEPRGEVHDSMQLLETGILDREGFGRIHVAGHPEGNRDIDADGGTRAVSQALAWKQAFAERTDADMAIVTQFCFDPDPVIAWAETIRAEGIDLPVHIGVAGPAKLQTLMRYAVACGVGPSLSVLQKRAGDLSTLLTPYEPTAFVHRLARQKAHDPDFAIAQVHLFPLGGLDAATDWALRYSTAQPC